MWKILLSFLIAALIVGGIVAAIIYFTKIFAVIIIGMSAVLSLLLITAAIYDGFFNNKH